MSAETWSIKADSKAVLKRNDSKCDPALCDLDKVDIDPLL